MNKRISPVEISKEEFTKAGYQLVDRIAGLFDSIRNKPVTRGESPKQLQQILGNASLPGTGTTAGELLEQAANLVMDHSLYNGHPKFFGYITSSPAPLGVLADMLAAAVNPNVGAQVLSPIATEIEKQTVRWLAEFIGVSPEYGGLLVSGGNMANFTGFLAGRTVKAPKSMRENGIDNSKNKLLVYCSKATHTWIEKAMILFGHGSGATRWIDAPVNNRMDTDMLQQTIVKDIADGYNPMMVIGTAGDVSTGAVDDLKTIGSICKKFDLWFHIDGAYGMPAAAVPSLKELFNGLEDADSIAIDPHKWLYSPIEAGCTLVKDPNHLVETFSSHPVYYNFETSGEGKPQNFYEFGLQNSRGFRALKVWLMLQHVGKKGYESMISEDIELSKLMFSLAQNHPHLEAVTQNLSITTLRYIPEDLPFTEEEEKEKYLNDLNETLLNELQAGGEVFLSNALVGNKYCLRACIVNFRTSEADIHNTVEIITRVGSQIHSKFQG